ncbi:hypothetical protein BDR05DRAFT_976999 [Suillus weaverae]|nr:hypothetical protein BDR05DRAFT_976999 [Suillus weaverae]
MPQTRCHQFNVHLLPCTHPGCHCLLKNQSALTQHLRAMHQHSFQIPERHQSSVTVEEVPDGPDLSENDRWQANFTTIIQALMVRCICNEAGQFLDPKMSPPAFTMKSLKDWAPYRNCLEFGMAESLFKKTQISAADIDKLLHFWGITLAVHGDNPPFSDHKDLYNVIDNTPLGDVPWESFKMEYAGDRLGGETSWMNKEYEVFYCDPHKAVQNMLANPDFKDKIDFVPYHEWEEHPDGSHNRRCRDFMSADWAWEQADIISADPATHGSTFVPIILRSDKTTVSVTTGQNDFYLLYLSISNSIDPCYHKFKKELFHTALTQILENLKPGMTMPEVAQCADGHYRHVIYGIGPYIADYEEQVVLAGIVRAATQSSDLDGDGGPQSCKLLDALIEEVDLGTLWDEWGFIADIMPFTNNFPRVDIYKLIAPDLLHQIIKGIFKDHLVAWVQLYLECTHGEARAKEIMDDIDKWIAVAPSFLGLRHFPEGRGFSQWTGDDSKALMKVYISAIKGHVPTEMTTGVHDHFSLPHQHSISHYPFLVRQFGAPNGLLKQPWQCSSKFNALGQMVCTNTCLDQLAAARVDFTECGMLDVLSFHIFMGLTVLSEHKRAHTILNLSKELHLPELPTLLQYFLHDQLYADNNHTSADVPLCQYPTFTRHIQVVNSAIATYFAPSDPSGLGGMHHECIHSTPSWCHGPPHHDCMFVSMDNTTGGINSMEIACVLCFSSFSYRNTVWPCAAVHWFKCIGSRPDEDMGMWMVRPSMNEDQSHEISIIYVDSIFHTAHLEPMFGDKFVPEHVNFHNSLDAYMGFYVNKFADHHAFKITS